MASRQCNPRFDNESILDCDDYNHLKKNLFWCKAAKCKNNTNGTSVIKSVDYENVLACCCGVCKEEWFICPVSSKRFSGRNRFSKLRLHLATLLVDVPTHNEILGDDNLVVYEDNALDDGCDHGGEEQSSKSSRHEHDLSGMKMSDKSKTFFSEESCGESHGSRSMMVRVFKDQVKSSALAGLTETHLQLDITRFCNSLKGNQLDIFANIMRRCQDKESFIETRVPLSMGDINKYYLRSKNSVMANIPTAESVELSGHSIVCLVTVIEHFLALGIEHNGIHNCCIDTDMNNSIHQTAAVKDIISDVKTDVGEGHVPELVLLLSFFSDDFEVNNIKKNRNSTWISTVTISPPKKKDASVE